MSAKNKRLRARQRRQQELRRQQQLAEASRRRTRRRRVILLTSTAAVLALVVAITGIVVQRQRAEDDGPAPRTVAAGGTAIPVGRGDAPVTLTVYEDFRCPACKAFEDRYGPVIDELVDEGRLRVEYHIATIIDAGHGGEGSKVAGNAAACAADAGSFPGYHARLFAHQPREDVDGFTQRRVTRLADGVSGLNTASFRSCVRTQRYFPWLHRVQAEFDERFDRAVTPTVLLDGKLVRGGADQTDADVLRTPASLRRAVTERAERASSPSPSATGR